MKKTYLLALLALFASPMVSAHTTSLGTVNAGTPGTVTLWMGSYHNGAPNEGSMTLNGVTQAFNLVTSIRPTGLVDGVNNFYAIATGGIGNGIGATGQYDQASWGGSSTFIPDRWQGVTFSGLAAGVYTYTISGMFSVNWADWNRPGSSNWTGTLTIPRSSVTTVPEPGTLGLLGLGLVGAGLARRRRTA